MLRMDACMAKLSAIHSSVPIERKARKNFCGYAPLLHGSLFLLNAGVDRRRQHIGRIGRVVHDAATDREDLAGDETRRVRRQE